MLEDKLRKLVMSERDVIPFLQSLDAKSKRELVPFLKKFFKEIFETRMVKARSGGHSYTQPENIHSKKKRELVEMCCYVCFNKTDAKRFLWNVSFLSISDQYIENIIPWYVPKWYSDLINENVPWELDYEKLMLLSKMKLLVPSEEIIVSNLTMSIVKSEWRNDKHISTYKPDILKQYPETLKEHIWLLFEQESNINNAYSYVELQDYGNVGNVWYHTIVNLISEGLLDRGEVISKTLYTSTKGFNKTLSGWFSGLILHLDPTVAEVIQLQTAFFVTLNSEHSKVVNTTLKYFKKVCKLKGFNQDGFIDQAMVLLNSPTKSVVNGTLIILDAIAKTSEKAKKCCLVACQAFLNQDEKIQLRAAKLINKHGVQDDDLGQEIYLYYADLYFEPKSLLNPFVTEEDLVFEEPQIVSDSVDLMNPLSGANKLTTYKTIDEIVFFLSQALENNNSYDIELLLSYFPKVSALVTEENVHSLSPIFKRSFDLCLQYDTWGSAIGQLDFEGAYYIHDVSKIFMSKFYEGLKDYREYRESKLKKIKKEWSDTRWLKQRLVQIESRNTTDKIYTIYKTLFVFSKNLVLENINLPLLSNPTHDPCWLDPIVFVDRILAYERIGLNFSIYDFQIALSRIPSIEMNADLHQAIEKLGDAELKAILEYLFGNDTVDFDKVRAPEKWLPVFVNKGDELALARLETLYNQDFSKEKGLFLWECNKRPFTYKEYDFLKKKEVTKTEERKELWVYNSNESNKNNNSFLSGIRAVFKKSSIPISSIFKSISFRKEQYIVTISPKDDLRFLMLCPNQPDLYLSEIVKHCLRESTFFSESLKQNVINVLKGLDAIWHRDNYGEMTYLFVGASLLCSDKVARQLASEVWVKYVQLNLINNERLGGVVGGLQFASYAPLKRFTDLISSNLLNIGDTHNKALLVVLNSSISAMSETPPRGAKKLLELFLELLHKTKTHEVHCGCALKIKSWKETKSLKGISSKILTLINS